MDTIDNPPALIQEFDKGVVLTPRDITARRFGNAGGAVSDAVFELIPPQVVAECMEYDRRDCQRSTSFGSGSV